METTPSPIIKPRNARTASRLSDLSYGLGQVYCGHLVRGLVIYVIGTTILVVWMALIGLMKGRFLEVAVTGLIVSTILWIAAKLDARRLAAKAPADYALKEYNRWYVYAMLVFLMLPIAVCGAFFIRATAFEAFHIVTANMSPAIQPGERVLIDKTRYDVLPMQRGDIVVIRGEDNRNVKYIKRLIALPGDKVEIATGHLLVNGQHVLCMATQDSSSPATKPVELTVPRGRGLFLWDNQQSSVFQAYITNLDWAINPLADVIGRAEWTYWPWIKKVR